MSLLIPGAGFIKAIMAIKDIIVFFVESAIMLIPAITKAILALASGSIAGVGMAIEEGLGLLIPLVIGLFAKLIGLGGLSKRVMKIFKKIRKRVDKAVNKLLKKAKKAGRKLMRKLGIGKKKKKKRGDADDRTPQEMQADLNAAITKGENFAKDDKNDSKKIDKKLQKYRKEYDLIDLKLIKDDSNENETTYHIEGEVNPKNKSKRFKKIKVYTQSPLYIGIADDMPGRASEMKPLERGTAPWIAAIKKAKNTINKEGHIQVKVKSSSDALAFIKAVFAKENDTEKNGIRLDRRKAHTQSGREDGTEKYDKGYEQHQKYEGGKLNNPHIKFYVGNANGHIFYEKPN